MRLLLTADAHLDHPAVGKVFLHDLTRAVCRHAADAVAVIGDIGLPSRARQYLRHLREAVGERDLWVSDSVGANDRESNAERSFWMGF